MLCWFNPQNIHHDFLLCQVPLFLTLSVVPEEDMSFTVLKSVYHIFLMAVIGSEKGLFINQSKIEGS